MSKETVLRNLQNNIAIDNFRKINKRQDKTKKILQCTLTTTLCALSVTGIVFAQDISTKIYENFFLTGKGMETAMNEGYIENTNMNYKSSNTVMENVETGKKIEDIDTKIKVDEFVMDDFNLSMTFNVEISEKIKNIIEQNEEWDIEFPDMIISDENNIVLFCTSGEEFNKFSETNNLGYDFDEALENGKCLGSGVNTVPIVREGNHVKVVYNIYTGGNQQYPKSKKLKIQMNKIKISKEEDVILTGDWKMEIDVPEKMYNRKTETYSQKNTTNEEYNVTSATLYDTGMKIKLEKKNVEQPKRKVSEEYEFYKTLKEEDEIKTLGILQYIVLKEQQMDENIAYKNEHMKLMDLDIYLTNSKGEKFEQTSGPSENGSIYIDKNGVLKYEGMFDLTKYDKTDIVTVHIDHNGKQEEIVIGKKEDK